MGINFFSRCTRRVHAASSLYIQIGDAMAGRPPPMHGSLRLLSARADLGSSPGTAMASVSGRWRLGWVLTACIFCRLIICCKSESDGGAGFHGQKTYDAVGIVGRAMLCFNDHYVYSRCEESLRLGPRGELDVPAADTEAFCSGPCLAETELVLRCVDAIMDSFRFYNGAAVGDVRFALARGCGHSGLRGDFAVLRRLGAGDGYLYGRGGAARAVSVVSNLGPPVLLSAAAAAAVLL